jgi:predicted dehydrogenase
MQNLKRREFLGLSTKTVVALGAASTTLGTRRPVRATPPSERVNLAAIGIGGRCTSLIRGFAERGDCTFKTLCDVYPERDLVGKARSHLDEKQGSVPGVERDFRRVLDDNSIDAVVVATPDHWHAPLTIFACQAGKDVYVEKPPSHNVWEGRQMAEAAKRYKRVVQVGTQNRSAPYVHEALRLVRSGYLGKVHLCKVYNLKSGGRYSRGASGTPPAGMDYDTWLGPAPERTFNRDVCYRGGWHKLWDFSGGDLADDGVHQMDIARWLVGKSFPTEVHATGGNFAFSDDREVPDTQIASFRFDDLVMTVELTQWPRYMRKTNGATRHGDGFPPWLQNATRIELYGTQRQLILGRHGGGWQIFGTGGKVEKEMFGRFPDVPHKENFVQCIRSRDVPNAPAEEGHRSAVLVHLANMSYRLGGRKLVFDGNTEQIVGDPDANRLIKREYRSGFEVPQIT